MAIVGTLICVASSRTDFTAEARASPNPNPSCYLVSRSELVSEFLADGFAHVAIVKGGFASLTAEQRASTLVSDDVAPDFAAADRPPDRLKEAMAAAERARVEAAESAKRAGEAVRKVFNFGRKPK